MPREYNILKQEGRQLVRYKFSHAPLHPIVVRVNSFF